MYVRLATTALFLLSTTNVAQAQLTKVTPRPITTEVKSAGTYHLASKTWTRGPSSVALAGPDVIYDNTCTVGYYFGTPEGTVQLDSGRIPSTGSPSNSNSLTGLYDLYEVNSVELGYCSFEPLVTSMEVGFSDCYSACSGGGTFPDPIAVIELVNVPAGTALGAQGCWMVNIDLSNTDLVFNLGGDCDGVYDNVLSTDSFGWTWTQTIPTTGNDSGLIFAGDPLGLHPQSGQVCGGVGAGTTFPMAGTGPGTGIGWVNQFEIQDGTLYGGCHWFGPYMGNNPLTSFYLKLEGTQGTPCSNNGTAYCFGDGSGSACPCANTGGPGEGCANSTGNGAILSATGCALALEDSIEFQVSGVNGSKPGLLLRGNNQINGGNGNPVGGGLICTAGASARSQVQVTAGGATTFSDWNGEGFGTVSTVGGSTYFQYWYRDPGSGSCGADFNFSNAWELNYTL